MTQEIDLNALETIEEVDNIAKNVFANAAKTKIALTPEAYQLWYEYFTGDNKDLVAEIKEIFASGKGFAPETINALFKKYFPQYRGGEVMEYVHRETQNMITTIFAELMQAGKDTNQFGGKLTGYSRQIKEATKVSEVQKLMKEMLRDTSKMVSSSRNLQEKLNEATQQAESLKRQLKESEKEASMDALTGLNNRKAFDQKLNSLYQEFKQSGIVFSLIFVDIDFFKKFNDTYGHKIGDLVLQTVASTLFRGVKGSDFPARYGGEEFVILLPATELENARIVAEQLRVQISVKKPTNPETGEVYSRITASLGISQIHPDDSQNSLVERADKALYLAKDSGRNNVKTELELS